MVKAKKTDAERKEAKKLENKRNYEARKDEPGFKEAKKLENKRFYEAHKEQQRQRAANFHASERGQAYVEEWIASGKKAAANKKYAASPKGKQAAARKAAKLAAKTAAERAERASGVRPPNFDFYLREALILGLRVACFAMRRFTRDFLQLSGNWSDAWPWDKRQPVLFGRFHPFTRYVITNATELHRRGRGGKNICRPLNKHHLMCEVRQHFMWDWVPRVNTTGVPIDVAELPRINMSDHAAYRWLLHMDGQSCSSRLEQLMALGSAVVKEESGYYAFFHHLLQPYKHYVPFWKDRPEEALEAIRWLETHDRDARLMGGRAQALAQRFLHKKAIMCYWFTLLKEMSTLLRYKPGKDRHYRHWLPVEEYMKTHGNAELDRIGLLNNMDFW